tara:strand:- start:162 stop:665 length:504 start_codon:yes stop_codon:yes gene_type:complete
MAWWDRIVDWGAEVIDPVAEYFNYVDDYADFDATEYSAGRQLIDDASDAFGFIKQGAKAYAQASGMTNAQGKRTVQQGFQPTQVRQTRSYRGMGFGQSGNPQFQVSQNMAVGANNPNIQTALAALMNSSYNTQMNNVVSQFSVSPNIGQGRKTSTGKTTLARNTRVT